MWAKTIESARFLQAPNPTPQSQGHGLEGFEGSSIFGFRHGSIESSVGGLIDCYAMARVVNNLTLVEGTSRVSDGAVELHPVARPTPSELLHRYVIVEACMRF